MKTIRIFVSLFLFAAATSLFAQMDLRPLIKVNVPFQFSVGERSLPAGEYLISAVQPERTIRIRSVHGTSSAILAVMPLYKVRPAEKTCLKFHHYNGAYFLAEVETAGQDVSRTLPKGKLEMEIARKDATPESTIVLAALTGR
jgi:hypothetical protein